MVSIPATTCIYVHRKTAWPKCMALVIISSADGAGVPARIMAAVLVERPGVFAVRAKIPQQSSEQAARRFTDIMQTAEADVKHLLGLA